MMKLSIRSFLVAACLLAPQVVESSETSSLHQITADAIANVLAASGPVSHRSLEDLTAAFESVIDDPDFITCLTETQELFEDYSDRKGVNFEDETTDMMANALEMEIGMEKSTMKTTYGKEIQTFIRNACSDAGGKYDAIGDFACEFSDAESGIDFTAEFSGMVYCWADIPECKAGQTFQFYAASVLAAGGTCTEPSGGSSISMPDSGTMTEQTDPDAALEEDSAAAEESGAVLGFQMKTGHLVMASILVAVVNFL